MPTSTRQLELVNVRYVPLGKSDHRGVLVTYAYGDFRFTMLTANGQYTDRPEDLVDTLLAIASYKATIVNLQEIATEVQRITADALPGYDVFWPGGRDRKTGKPKAGPKNHNPIAYRPDVALFSDGDWHQAHLGLLHVSPTRGISEGVFDLAGLLELTDLNLHAVNGVDGAGRTPKAWRRLKHKKTLALFARLLKTAAARGPAAGSGDFNTTRRALLPLPGAHFDIPNHGGSHGTRPIDWWVRPATHATTPEDPMADDRYDRVTLHGKRVNKITRAALQEAEKRLGYELTIVQGSYNGTAVSASAGTHSGGGVVDLLAWDHERKVKTLREIGFAAWYRPAIKGLWGEHIHAVLIGDKSAAPSAQRQVESYKRGRNGLANNGPDNGPRVGIHTFAYPPKVTPKPEPAKPPKPPVPSVPDTPVWDNAYRGFRIARDACEVLVTKRKTGTPSWVAARTCLGLAKTAIKLTRKQSTKH